MTAPGPGAEPDGAGGHAALMLALGDLARELAGLREEAGGSARLQARLDAADEELRVVGEEIAAQALELQTSRSAGRGEEGRLRRLLAGLPVALLASDRSGAVLESNPAAAALLGVPSDRLVRKPLLAYVAEGSRREGRRLVAAAARERTAEGTLVLTPRNKAAVVCHVTVVSEEAGKPAGLRWMLEPVAGPSIGGDGGRLSREAVVELLRLGVGGPEPDLRTLLGRVAALVCDGLPEVVAASVVLGAPEAPALLASSSTIAQAADAIQHAAGVGPLFDAHASARVVVSLDLVGDAAWPGLGRPGEAALPVSGCVAIPLLPAGLPAGVLALYLGPGTDTDGIADRAQPYVVAAEVLMRDSHELRQVVLVRDQLRAALDSRATIDQATGVIMATQGGTSDQAFAALTRMSNVSNRKVRDLAAEIVQRAAVRSG